MDTKFVDSFLKYLPPPKNFSKVSDNILKITLDAPHQRVYFVGQAKAKVSLGVVQISGYSMHETSPDNYFYLCSSKTTAISCIEYGGPNGGVIELYSVKNGLERIQNCQGSFNEILAIEGVEPDIPGLWCLKAPLTGDLVLYEPIDQWNAISLELKRMQEPIKPVILVCGPRKVGKSSFCRFLANSLLEKNSQVIMIDLDLGQTEFMPPGSISAKILSKPLLGPPFTHIGTADLAFYVGATTPNEDYTAYLRNVEALVSASQSKFRGSAPIVINTMGWITGLGFCLLQCITHLVRPTHIISFLEGEDGMAAINRVLYEQNPLNKHIQPFGAQEKISVASMKPVVTGSTEMKIASPGELRNLSLWSYFYYDHVHEVYDFGRSLADFVPYVMPWDQLRIHWNTKRGLGLRAELANAVANLNLVGLAISKDPTDSLPVMIGVGIIRGVNPQERSYYVVSPLPSNLFAQVNCIILGTVGVPAPIIYYRNKLEGPYLSYYSAGDTLGGNARKVRYNLQRIGHQQN